MLYQPYYLLEYITSFTVPENTISYNDELMTGISFGFIANVFTNISNESFKVKWAKLLHKDLTSEASGEEVEMYDLDKWGAKKTLLPYQPIYWVANDGEELKAENQYW